MQNTQTEDNVQQIPTEMSQGEVEAVERVRQVYRQICSRQRRVQLQPQQPKTSAPVEQPAPTQPQQPIRALW